MVIEWERRVQRGGFLIPPPLAAIFTLPLVGRVDTQPKSGLSDFGQFKLPNSDKPEFGCVSGWGSLTNTIPYPPPPTPPHKGEGKADVRHRPCSLRPRAGRRFISPAPKKS